MVVYISSSDFHNTTNRVFFIDYISGFCYRSN